MKVLHAALVLVLTWLPAAATTVSAQPANQGGMQGMNGMPMTCPHNCPMCGMMGGPAGIIMMVLAWVLVLAVIGVLVALTVFLIRRSRPTKQA